MFVAVDVCGKKFPLSCVISGRKIQLNGWGLVKLSNNINRNMFAKEKGNVRFMITHRHLN